MEKHECIMESRVRALETGQAETKVYVKQILDDIQEIKTTIKNAAPPPQADKIQWQQTVIIELIKVLSTAITVIGTVIGILKVTGKG